MRVLYLAWLGVGVACGAVDNGAVDAPPGADGPSTDAPATIDAPAAIDAAVDAPGARCVLSRPFDTPVALSTLNTTSDDHAPVLSPDELTIYFGSNRPGGVGGFDVYVATRSSSSAAFGTPALVNGINTAEFENRPAVTADGLTLYVETRRSTNPYHLLRATRTATTASFGALQAVPELTTSANEVAPTLVPDGSAIYFMSNRVGANQLYRAERSGGGFGVPSQVVGTNLANNVADYPMIAADQLTLMFPSNLAGGMGGVDIWVATRPSVAVGFSAPTALTELNTTGTDYPGWLSPDGCVLYIARANGAAGLDIFVARRPAM